MDHDDFNRFCKRLKASTYVMQWGGSHVWKVGGKVYAIGTHYDDLPAYTFKVTPISYDLLKEQPRFRPAPYLASRGMKWIQYYGTHAEDDEDVISYIRQSHALVVNGLSKKLQKELGLQCIRWRARDNHTQIANTFIHIFIHTHRDGVNQAVAHASQEVYLRLFKGY